MWIVSTQMNLTAALAQDKSETKETREKARAAFNFFLELQGRLHAAEGGKAFADTRGLYED